MTGTLRILALIPARGGSKRLPGKNKRLLGGKPLIVWSIEAAQGIPEICDILVSTDDPEIAAISEAAGAMVPWLRPAELATDTATSVDVALHALGWYEREHEAVDGLLLLQATSPFRSRATTQLGIALFVSQGCLPVVSVSTTHAHPMWTMKLEAGFLAPFIEKHGLNTRSQDLPPAYVVNGNFYLLAPQDLRLRHSFLGDKTVPLLIDSEKEALDIDTAWDFQFAEYILKQLKPI